MNALDAIAADTQRKIAELVNHDAQAPLFHFLAPSPRCECFDPNGAIFWKGRYHLFYIFQDPARSFGPEFWQRGHCWGHASSSDLIHWQHHGVALAAEPDDPEAAIYSGCALLNKEGVPTIVYHGYNAGTCIATSTDDELNHWVKSPHNPVIPEPKKQGDAGWGIYNVFDPHVWLEGETYYAILGGGVKPHDEFDTAYLFRSRDLVQWEYLHPFYQPDSHWTSKGDDCACPKFFRLSDKHVLLFVSHATGTRYYVGRYENNHFFPEEHHLMNWPGGCCFAPETMLDGSGRRIMWAWAVDQRIDWWKQGEIGVLTLPRVLSTNSDGSLRIEPPPELASLRRNHQRFESIELFAGDEMKLDTVTGDCLEIKAVIEVPLHGRCGLKVRVSPDGEEQTMIAYDRSTQAMLIDTSRSAVSNDGWRPYPMDFWRGVPVENLNVQRMPLEIETGELLALRIFIDRSILEVFINDKSCMTQRIYPRRADSTGVTVFSEGDRARVLSVDTWEMHAVNSTAEGVCHRKE